MGHFGDMDWASATGGELRGMERALQIAEAVRFRIAQRLRSTPKALGLSSADEADRLMREIELPQTKLVVRAVELVTKLGPAALLGHALRTWAWGTILGIRDGLAFDRETFALSALLHDVALSRRTENLPCFAVDGARQATGMLSSWGASEALAMTVGNAISMHVRVSVPKDLPEAHLVHAGAGVDVLGGPRFLALPVEVREGVIARYPRLGLKQALLDAFDREHREHPTSRIALWVSMGFLERIRNAPFSD
jgi:hypothetical protein